MVTVVANQKGGVGKTTTATSYAEFGIAGFVPSRWLCRADGVEAVVCPAVTRVLGGERLGITWLSWSEVLEEPRSWSVAR